MSLAGAVTRDARGKVAGAAAGREGVETVEYADPLGLAPGASQADGCVRWREEVRVTFDRDADATDLVSVVCAVENLTDWVENYMGEYTDGRAFVAFTRPWWEQ